MVRDRVVRDRDDDQLDQNRRALPGHHLRKRLSQPFGQRLAGALEVAVHGWDVARASGQQTFVDDAALAPSREFVALMSGPDAEEARGDAFGPALPVPAGASALDEVIAGNGRDPAWSAGGGA